MEWRRFAHWMGWAMCFANPISHLHCQSEWNTITVGPLEAMSGVLLEAVEGGRCSWDGAELIMEHVQRFGRPWRIEEAYQIDGLTQHDLHWLMQQTWWKDMAVEQMRSSAKSQLRRQTTFTSRMERGGSSQMVLRYTGPNVRGQLHASQSMALGGCAFGPYKSIRWMVGDHQPGWGHGLAIPRPNLFGTVDFLGADDSRAARNSTPLHHRHQNLGLRGILLEKNEGTWPHGMTLGQHHCGLFVRREMSLGSVGVSLFATDDARRASMQLEWDDSVWSHEHALCLIFEQNEQGWKLRSGLRRGWGREAMLQTVLRAEGFDKVEAWSIQSNATWNWTATQGQLQLRLRLRSAQSPDLRAKFSPSRHSHWTWQVHSVSSEHHLAISHRRETVKFGWVVGTVENQWAQGRYMEWKMGSRNSIEWLGFVADGQGRMTTAYYSVPRLDGRVWSRVPGQGWKMGMVLLRAKPLELRRKQVLRWTLELSWDRTKNFQCALRGNWEAPV